MSWPSGSWICGRGHAWVQGARAGEEGVRGQLGPWLQLGCLSVGPPPRASPAGGRAAAGVRPFASSLQGRSKAREAAFPLAHHPLPAPPSPLSVVHVHVPYAHPRDPPAEVRAHTCVPALSAPHPSRPRRNQAALFGGNPRYENVPLIGRGSPPPTVSWAPQANAQTLLGRGVQLKRKPPGDPVNPSHRNRKE